VTTVIAVVTVVIKWF